MTDPSKKFHKVLAENTVLKQKIQELEQLESERVKMKEALIKSENWLHTIVEGTHALLVTVDMKGHFTYANDATAKAVGYATPEELIGKPYLHFIYPEDRERVFNTFINQIDARQPSSMQEFRVSDEEGNIKWYSFLSTLAIKDGQLIGQSGVAQDITRRKRVEEALRENEELYRSVLNASPDNITMTDVTGKILMISPAGVTMFGYDRAEEVIGDNVASYLDPIDRERAISNLSLKAQGVLSGPDEYRGLRKDGSTIDIEVMSSFIRDDNEKPIRVIVVVRDISDRKRAENERKKMQIQLQHAQKMEAIGTLAGGIAHDFNNILAAILGYAEMARSECPPGSNSANDLLEVVLASERARDLVRQILAFSRKSNSKKIPLRPTTIVKESLRLLRSSIPTTISIQQNIESDILPILADPTEVHQVIMNLCTNAYHAMEETGGRIHVALKNLIVTEKDLESVPDTQPGHFVQLTVKDTGYGISPETMDRIYNPYFTTKEMGKGTGMGLAIVHGIVKECGGSMTCESEVGKGTVFSIIFPACEEHAVDETTKKRPVPTGTEHILFVDDEKMLVNMVRNMLEHLGYTVTARTDSREALALFKSQPGAFDLVITDQTMPNLTGVDLSRSILQIRPDMPIILCTGFSNLISEEKAKDIGIKGFAMKPLTKRDLGFLIREILDRKSTVMFSF